MNKKNVWSIVFLMLVTLVSAQKKKNKTFGAAWAVEPSPVWNELKKNPIPEWMIDAKFGCYTHWGIYSVPAHGGPDYLKEMYVPGDDDRKGVKKYHTAKYGPVEKFGYKDFIPMFKAEKFSADNWVGLMDEAGAKFGGICLAHHDGFCLWDSKYTKWDAKDMGPKRDIYGEIVEAVRKRDMKLLGTFHMARTYGYPFDKRHTKKDKKTLDIYDPKYSHIYRNPETEPKENFGKEWGNKVREVINNYRPDALWFDGLYGSIKNNEVPQDTIINIFSDYFKNKALDGDDVVICNKLPGSRVWNFPLGFGLRCYENCRDMEESPEGYWLADRAISYPWSYVNNKNYKHKAPYQVRSIIDMVSRGGIMLMSLTPKGDGSIDPQEVAIMKGIGKWMSKHGEAIYATRKWKIHGEGPTKMFTIKKKTGRPKWDFTKLNAADVRFTRSKDSKTLYAIVLGTPESKTYTVKTLAKGKKFTNKGIKKISFVASGEEVKWERTEEGLKLQFPDSGNDPIANAFKIELEGELL